MVREIPLELSVANVKSLAKSLKALAKKLDDDVKVDIERATCATIAEDVRLGISSIQDLDGNYLGADNPNASVNVEVGLPGHDVVWRGEQIAYLEFGTGASGALHPYPGTAMGATGYYRPDPKKAWWVYKDARLGAVLSQGLIPQAPMYNASVAMRTVSQLGPARRVLRGALDAVAV